LPRGQGAALFTLAARAPLFLSLSLTRGVYSIFALPTCSRLNAPTHLYLILWRRVCSAQSSKARPNMATFLSRYISARLLCSLLSPTCTSCHINCRATGSRNTYAYIYNVFSARGPCMARCNDPIMAPRGKRRFRFVAATARSANK